MDEVVSLTTSFLAVYLFFRVAPFAKNLTALRSAGRRRKLARMTRVCRRNCSLYFGHATVAFLGQLESGSSVINTTEGMGTVHRR